MNLFHLPLELHENIVQFITPLDFYHLRKAYPNKYYGSFKVTFIMRHLVQNGTPDYKNEVFNYFIQKSNFERQQDMLKLGYRNDYLIQRAIKHTLKKSPTFICRQHVFFLLDQSNVHISFDQNTILCWAVKKNNFFFVRDLMQRELIDISIGNYRVLSWAIKFYQPSVMLGDIIRTLIPFRFDHEIKFLARQACMSNKYNFFRDYEDFIPYKNTNFMTELLTLCIVNFSQLTYVVLLQLYHTKLETIDSRHSIVESLFNTAVHHQHYDAFVYLFHYTNDCMHFDDVSLLRIHRKMLSVAVVTNNFDIFDYLINDNGIGFDSEQEKIFVYYFSIIQNLNPIFNCLLKRVPPTSLYYGSWLLFYTVRAQKNAHFEQLVENGLQPTTLPRRLLSISSLGDFHLEKRSMFETNTYPRAWKPRFVTDITDASATLLPSNTDEAFLVFNTSYIHSPSLGRSFIGYLGEIRQGYLAEKVAMREYGRNCRKLHCFLQKKENTLQNVVWGHFLRWLEVEGLGHCGHSECTVGVEMECLFKRTFNMNFPHAITNVTDVEQEFYHL